jgi:hypothetical protein
MDSRGLGFKGKKIHLFVTPFESSNSIFHKVEKLTLIEVVSKSSIRPKIKAARCVQPQEYIKYFED